jgi:glyoxylase-like metal-dependent hydrolase (beta-lactamase superfamily II)
LFPGIEVRFFNGHTDGQAIPFIKYKGKTIVFTSDLLPTAAHLPLPWVMSYDTRPLITLDEKELFLEEAVDKGYVLFFEHDLYTECCTLVRTEKGIKVDKSMSLKDLL